MAKEIINVGNNIQAVVCDEFKNILRKSANYEPLRWNKDKVNKAIDTIVKPGTLDLNLWSNFVAVWKKYSIILTYGFYDPNQNIIFLNLPLLGIRVSTDCKIYTNISTSTYQFLSTILAHELIHYIFQTNIVSIYGFIKPLLLKYYENFWSGYFEEGSYQYVAKANFFASINMNINMIDKDIARAAYNSMNRFISILERFKDSEKVTDKQGLIEVITIMRNVLTGQAFYSTPKTRESFCRAYTSIYDGCSTSLEFGQELIYASEILSRSTDTPTMTAKLITRRLLKSIKV